MASFSANGATLYVLLLIAGNVWLLSAAAEANPRGNRSP